MWRHHGSQQYLESRNHALPSEAPCSMVFMCMHALENNILNDCAMGHTI